MINFVHNPKLNNYIVFCDSEDSLNEVFANFEAFLQEHHLRLFVKMGRMVLSKFSFEFQLTSVSDDEKKMILDFLKPNKAQVSRYRVIVDGYEPRNYPTNDLTLAIILCKSLDQETGVNVGVELYEYAPYHKEEWIVWKDAEGKTAKDITIAIVGGVMTITNLVVEKTPRRN